MQKEPEKVGGNLRKSLVDPNEKLPQVSRAKCLALVPVLGRQSRHRISNRNQIGFIV